MKKAFIAIFAFFVILTIGPAFQTPAIAAGQGLESTGTAKVKISPKQLLVRPKNAQSAPALLSDPSGWIRSKQRYFYSKMAGALQKIRRFNSWQAAWLLMFMSFVYGILHAAGPGHGKAVISAWLLANEQQLRRGIIIAAMAAFVQAVTAIVLVSGLLALFVAVGTKARLISTGLTAASFGLIGLVGLYLIYQALKSGWPGRGASTVLADGTLNASNMHHGHHHHEEDCPVVLSHSASCDCGHAHMPLAADVAGDWSWSKAAALAVAVGIRPCSGAILVLLLSSTAGIYWAGIASTFAMAVGTGITVSAMAALAVFSKNLAMKFAGDDSGLVDRIMFVVKLLAGLFIAITGGFLFWASLPI